MFRKQCGGGGLPLSLPLLGMMMVMMMTALPDRSIAQSLQKSMAMEPPQVTISFPDVGDYDFKNDTVAVMSNSNAAFEMLCNASYPIEWIFHYDRADDGTSEKVKLADTYRKVEDFTRTESYRYGAKLRLEYKGKLLTLSNFTCKATETDQPLYQTHVYMKELEEKSILILEVEVGGEYKGAREESQPAPEKCTRAVAQLEYPRWRRNPCWKCFQPQDGQSEEGKELELDFQWCKTPIECNSIHRNQKHGKTCLEVKEVEEVSEGCKSEAVAFFPRLLLCKNFGPALAQFYFFGVFKGDWNDEEVDGPPIFFSWEDANPSDMLHLHSIQEKVYLGEEIQFKCEYSKYYFSLGSWLGVSSPSGTEYIEGFDIKPCETDSEERNSHSLHNCNTTWPVKRFGTFYTKTMLTFNQTGEHRVSCFGPVWNTTQWVNDSLTFQVEMGEEPRVLSLGADELGEDFVIGEEDRSLICRFKGTPQPKVIWEGPDDSFYPAPEMTTNSSTQSVLKLREIGKKSSGVYTCRVSSFLGNHSQSFTINSHLPSMQLSGGAVAGIVVACVFIFVLVLAVIGRLVLIIARQRKALRLLTESEVQDFLQGNPELSKGKMDFIDSQFAIDALAYDQRYEIPLEKLAVDYACVLGSGQFGVVLRGKMNPRAVSMYLNFGDDGAPLDAEEINVAVKTTKKDVDVTSFKGILSEVKVMAYLGKHENIVSLVGASTQNIRNRELLIAVEFCHNGSLDFFLRKNKERFLNKVKYGFFAEEGEGGEGQKEENGNDNGGYINMVEGRVTDNRNLLKRTDSGWEFSTMDLFHWTHDIAQGLEYIHNKKVIHGDLAIRNVLLTQDFTAKVGDFGLSRQLGGMSNYIKKTQCPLPWRNMAVESLKEMNFSPKSDIWSMGVTIWELFTLGDVPYPGLNYSMDFLRDLENGTLRLFKPANATNDLYELLLMCWERRPEDRPNTTEVKLLCEKLFKKARSL